MIGKEISPILEEIETILWDFEENGGLKPCYSHEAFRASIKILMSALLDKMWELQEKEGIDKKDRELMAISAGKDIRDLIKTYTNIDTFDLYKNI